jgi:hypothetical protein
MHESRGIRIVGYQAYTDARALVDIYALGLGSASGLEGVAHFLEVCGGRMAYKGALNQYACPHICVPGRDEPPACPCNLLTIFFQAVR